MAALADASAVPCYLETAVSRRVQRYGRYGFDVVGTLVLPESDVRGWLMRRPASAVDRVAGPPTHPSRSGSG